MCLALNFTRPVNYCYQTTFAIVTTIVFLMLLIVSKTVLWIPLNFFDTIGNKGKGQISKRVFQENKARQFF